MTQVRKKPVVVNAMQWTGDNYLDIKSFTDGAAMLALDDENNEVVQISTLEGVMTASKNDWLIRGVHGELYPCKPDIFEETYETATAPDSFDVLLTWLRLERERYQTKKWDYADDDLQHALDGLGEESWFWQRGVENYVQRVRLFGITSPNGIQALMKLVATLLSIPEHLMRGGELADLPEPGHTSGEIVQW